MPAFSHILINICHYAFIIVIVTRKRWEINVVLICISLVAYNAELASCIHNLLNYFSCFTALSKVQVQHRWREECTLIAHHQNFPIFLNQYALKYFPWFITQFGSGFCLFYENLNLLCANIHLCTEWNIEKIFLNTRVLLLPNVVYK